MGVVVAAAVWYRRCVSHAVQAAVGKAESRQRETRAMMVDGDGAVVVVVVFLTAAAATTATL